MRSFVFFLAIALLFSEADAADFWYGVNGPEALVTDSHMVTLMFEHGFGINQQQELLESVGRLATMFVDEYTTNGFVTCSLTTPLGYSGFLDSLEAIEGIMFVEPYYRSSSGTPMLAGDGLCIAFEDSIGGNQVDSMASAYGIVLHRELAGLENVFVFRNTGFSGHRIVELANTLHELPSIRYAHPDFRATITTNSYALYDYYHEHQPHTKKVIGQFNQASVWDFSGLTNTVVVAVIDDGVAPHEDLPASRILPGYDFAGGEPDWMPDGDPSPGSYEAHGMACAGIIGASHTTDPAEGQLATSGVISLDPHVQILPVKIFTDEGSDYGMTASDLADAFGFAWTQGADVITNSWGYTDPQYPDQPILNDAIERAYAFGRGGRGCPVIFSSGNITTWFPNPYGVNYPARLEQCLAVGAIDLNDYRWYYSRYGSELDLVAPSDDGYSVGVWSLDQMGALGWNPAYMSDCPPTQNDQNYECHFGGTSAACPMVSAILRASVHYPPVALANLISVNRRLETTQPRLRGPREHQIPAQPPNFSQKNAQMPIPPTQSGPTIA
ncbi:S8 family serine peptidase [candidate division GN15 bacterium]|nr:S8 family serine peptidase [candidate division GN15 bacterium]